MICVVLCLLSFLVYNFLQNNLKLLFLPQVDAALIATGRAPFTKGLGLENVSKKLDIDILEDATVK